MVKSEALEARRGAICRNCQNPCQEPLSAFSPIFMACVLNAAAVALTR